MALELGSHLMSLTGQLRYHPTSKWVRASYAGEPVVDTTGAMLVWEPRRVVPMYAVPRADVHARLVRVETEEPPTELPPILGPVNFGWHFTEGQAFDLEVSGQRFAVAAFAPADSELGGRVVIEWAPFEWQEEGVAVTGHPHDPFKRIDTLPSDRHVVVALAGQVLADTRRGVALYETHIPTRWYLPREDVRMDLLEPGASTSLCAYKGRAHYFSVRGGGEAGVELAWSYAEPLSDAQAVRDHVCFYSERSDLTVDGVEVPRPRTPWSSRREQELY